MSLPNDIFWLIVLITAIHYFPLFVVLLNVNLSPFRLRLQVPVRGD